ncbi:hypothetical protein ANCCAN_04071 [Ancylostoma caninum]|uniref:CHK kinase-like domain-containing protein n=1 Tax=Ancylostoma caninum TaxID=29170 RepID=A0A368H231_ANCCA|nr:hypothetical protein ANCCAN_04071 [Ancylostoma caninum]
MSVWIPCSTAANNTFESSGATIENADSLEKIVHGLEIKFYRLIQDEKPKRLLVPALYAAEDYDSKQPVIVMEDYQNCFSVDLKLFFIAEQIAHLQIFSIRNKRWITVVQKNERDWLNHMKRTIPSLTRSISQKLMENMPGKLSCLKIFLENTIDKDPDWMGTIVDQYFNGEKPFVMIHGDMWSGQILWRDENTMAGIVDWQGAHRGSPDEVKHISPLCCIPCIFGVAFIPKSDIVKRNEKPDNERINTFVNRCEAFVEDVIELCGWQMKHE